MLLQMCVQVFLWTRVFSSLREMPTNGIAGSNVNSVALLRNCLIALQSSCTISHAHQPCLREGPLSLYLHRLFISWWWLKDVGASEVVSISLWFWVTFPSWLLMLTMCSQVTYLSSLERYLLNSFAKLGCLFIVALLSFPYSRWMICKYFVTFCGFFF